MWRSASDFPDKQVWPPGLSDAPAEHDSGSGTPPLAHRPSPPEWDWEPERLSLIQWRKLLPAGVTFVLFAGVGLWLSTTNAPEPQAVPAALQPSGGAWDAAGPPGPVVPMADERVAAEPSPLPSATTTRNGKIKAAQADPTPSTYSGESSSPQLSTRRAHSMHSRYQQLLSAAQTAMNDKAIGTLEWGLALDMTRASLKTARMEGTTVAAGIWPNTRVWVPRHIEGTPDWFVAVSYEPGVARITDVLAATPAGWRLVASTADTRSTPAKLPAIATDSHGRAMSLSEDATGLRGTPGQVARAHLASLQDARLDPRFADGPWTSDAVLFWQQEREQLSQAGWNLTLTYRPSGLVRALRTTDGGALIWYATRSTDTRTAERAGAKVGLKGAAAVRTGNRSFSQSVTATYGRMYVAYVPPAGSTEPVRVMGEWSDVLDTYGT